MSTRPTVTASTRHETFSTAQTGDAQAPSAGHTSPPPGPRTLDSRDLLGDQAMVLIRHLGEIYRLQSTRQGKLILTK